MQNLHCFWCSFFRFIIVEVARPGGIKKEHGLEYYFEKQRQICQDYNVLPDVLKMTLSDIDYWYDGIKDALIKYYSERSK